MVVLQLISGAPSQMYWKYSPIGTTQYIRPETVTFSYTEKLDYDPVFIELDPENLPTEVGLFVNGECKGAAVVDSTVIEIPLYKDEEAAKDDAEIQIALYFAGKGNAVKSDWLTFNKERLVFEKKTLHLSDIVDYAYISFKATEGSSIITIPTILEQNYPNPFNPETNISFILKASADAELTIYNLKGQKVKTLHSGLLVKGRHTLVWNGTDAEQKSVSSGVYFYKLSSGKFTSTRKMILLK
jgi:hypothetical protein